MERYKKKDMLQTVDMLLKANDAIVRTTRSNPKGAAEALVQCQESAIALGTYIDTLDEKYANLVHILEDYCENIYQMSENLSDESVCRKASKKIQKQMTSLRNGIKYDLLDDKKEIVFLPYKASMWDSLESVWKAADADPECDAYVIPIPYFDKNPDGSFRKEHYEGDLYPKNVPITRYDEYDLEARHPDVIYIHNPYDECNHVTSVHPYFYSKNLRNHTDKLVYIPYFVLGEIEPDNQAAINGMKHFCFTPGTVYADQVIVQSENMRQIYINEYIKAAKEMELGGEHVDRKFLEKKFLGTGSPKFDKVLNTKKEDLEIPAEWLKIIEKPDGSWKKIIFYNTSVSALLHHDEKMLRKMESVFGVFQENQDEVALLWRPHPLIQATIESMRPQLWEAYKEIKDKYIAEGWGIYDDTADMDRAVVLSDAYYGDRSSVAHLFRGIKKGIMYQNPDAINNSGCRGNTNVKGEVPFLFEDCVLVKDKIYLVNYNITALFSMDIHTGEIKYVDRIPNEILVQIHFVSKILVYKNILLLIPARTTSSCVWLYDLEKKIWNSLVFDDRGIKAPYEKFEYATIYKNELFMVGCYYPDILCIDLDSYQMTCYEVFENDMKLHSLGACECVGEQLYISSPTNNSVIVFNMRSKEHKEIAIGDKENSYSGITKNGGTFWLSPYKNTSIVQWDGKNRVVEYSLPNIFQNIAECIFNGITSYKNRIYVYGTEYKQSFAFLDSDYNRFDIIENSFLLCKRLGENYFITCDYGGNVQIIFGEEEKNFINYISERGKEEILEKWKKELQEKGNIELAEDDFMKVDSFLVLLKTY